MVTQHYFLAGTAAPSHVHFDTILDHDDAVIVLTSGITLKTIRKQSSQFKNNFPQ